jgi:NADH dehydrogenase
MHPVQTNHGPRKARPSMIKRSRVVIVGAGFGGLWAARALARSPVDVLLVDRNNYHVFLPLLYQVAAAELEPEEIAYPIRSILRRLPNVRFALAEVKKVDLDGRVVESADMAIPYDFLILSVGSTTHFFGVPGAAEHAFPLKDMDQAIALRNHLLCCFERAAHESDADRRQQILTFVIVGGGPTGVEFAGALAELIHRPLVRDYPNLDFCQVRVVLVEAKDSVLPDLPQRLRAYASARLRRMGIEVRVRAVVSQVARDSVRLKDGSTIRTETLIWTAGVRGVPQAQAWGLATARNGRAVSLPTLQVPDHPEAYVIGDLAHREESGRALPMIAPVAIQQGVAAAQNIARQLAGHGPVAFHYRDPGLMVTIGRNAAVACVRGRCFTGFSAWLLWLSVHIYKLIGFRNRLLVLINWAWDYFLYERAVRLILPSQQRELAKNQRT